MIKAYDPMAPLTDRFGRTIHYLRLSVTDRCDFRCTYCMAEQMRFLPRRDLLSLEELTKVAGAFRNLGVDKLRVTGGEPLIRRDVLHLFRALGTMGFADLSLTTNGARLEEFADALVAAGVDRVNISLDSLRPARFSQLTRHGDLNKVLNGVEAARRAGFKKIKINVVTMKHINFDETADLVNFCLDRDFDISFIEEMPLGEITSHNRDAQYVSSPELRTHLAALFPFAADATTTGGPSRYWRVLGSRSRVGFISPHSENFCSTCNRVRVSPEGRLLLCLGNEHSVDLKKILRDSPAGGDQNEALQRAIQAALSIKPKEHHFDLKEQPQILRFMNATGG